MIDQTAVSRLPGAPYESSATLVSSLPAHARVLIVDDEPAIAKLVEDALMSEGFECETCVSGEEALAVLEARSIDAVISDLHMPGMSGLDLLRTVHPTRPFLAFVIITGVNDLTIGIKAMKEGSDDYLVKPFQMAEAVAAVRRALERRSLEREVDTYRQRLEDMVNQRTNQLRAAMRRIEYTYDETLGALGAALDLRDNETAGHSYRVMRYCLAIAQQMGCSKEQMTNIARGAFLHDIGKIGVPDAILRKPAKLTDAETAVMQTHVRIGYDLVSRIAFLSGASAIILTHHERFDGTGYPQGLMGVEIPIGARIFVIADTLDAMTSDRPYRLALPFSTAREEIIRQAGRQFDPEVVEAFLRIAESEFSRIRHAQGLVRAEQRMGNSSGFYEALANANCSFTEVADPLTQLISTKREKAPTSATR